MTVKDANFRIEDDRNVKKQISRLEDHIRKTFSDDDIHKLEEDAHITMNIIDVLDAAYQIICRDIVRTQDAIDKAEVDLE